MPVSALVFKVGVLDVRLHQFGKLLTFLFMFFFLLFSAVVCFSASGWRPVFLLVFFASVVYLGQWVTVI